jgi:hypothetical protein
MAANPKKAFSKALAVLSAKVEIPRPITENLPERQILRRVISLAEQRQRVTGLCRKGGRHDE